MSDATHATVERWRPVLDWEDLYEVSDHGRVRSLDRVATRGTGTLRLRGRVLSPGIGRDGRRGVILCRGGRNVNARISVLMLEAFVGPRPPGMDGCHNNGDPSDNRLSNLRWDTRRENMLDKGRHGTDHNARKTRCPRGHRLIEPNLCEGLLVKYGRRSCLACSRTHPRHREAKRAGRPFDFLAEADSIYASLPMPPT